MSSTQELERRVWPVERLEVREKQEYSGPVIEGYAAVFDSLSVDLGGWRERIAPAALGRDRGLDGLLHKIVGKGVVAGFVLAKQLRGQGLLDGQHCVQLRQCAGGRQQRRREGFAGQGCCIEHAAPGAGMASTTRLQSS